MKELSKREDRKSDCKLIKAKIQSFVIHEIRTCRPELLRSALIRTPFLPRLHSPPLQHFTRPSNSSLSRDDVSSRQYDSNVAVAMVDADTSVSVLQTA